MNNEDGDHTPRDAAPRAADQARQSMLGPGLTTPVVLDALPDVALLVDAEHTILYANRAFRMATGLELDALVGQYCPQAVHGLATPFPGCPLEESVHGSGGAVGKDLFVEETGRWFDSAVYPTGVSTKEGKPVYLHLIRDITDAKSREAHLTRVNRSQAALDRMLRHSLVDASMEEILAALLGELLSIPWLELQKKGAILLVDEAAGNLEMVVQQGMSSVCVERCRAVPEGRCLCGLALKTGEVVFADSLDDRHEVSYDGIASHGHYCVPIRNSERVIGVLNAYLDAGHTRRDDEERFLLATADVIAGVVGRERSRSSIRLFRDLLDRARDAVLVADLETGRFTDVNDEACRRLGYTREEFRGLAATEILRGIPSAQNLDQYRAVLREKGSLVVEEHEYAKDGTVIPVEASVSLVHSGGKNHVVVVSRDITERLKTESDLRTAAALFEDAQEGMIFTDPDGTIVQVNPAFARLAGFSREDLIGKSGRLLLSSTVSQHFQRRIGESIRESGRWMGEIPIQAADGREMHVWVSVAAVRKASGETHGLVATFHDVSALKEAEEAVRQLSLFDPLTRLPNRAHLMTLVQDELVHARRHSRHLAVAHFDLNRFTQINDLLGFVDGDRILVEVAGRLGRSLREGDIVARLGNDEFTVVLVDLAEPTDAGRVIQGMFDGLGEPLAVGDHVIHLTASVGVAMFPGDAGEPDVLMRLAGTALQHAKHHGDNCTSFYSKEMDADVARRLTLEAQLRQALDRDELRLWFQPKLDLRTGATCGMEALVRWQHPSLGMVPPMSFIPIAEETGLIIPIGEWVVGAACRALRTLGDRGHEGLTMAVNLSARQFRDAGLIDRITAAVKAAGVDASRIELEITESMMIDDPDSVVRRLRSLKDHGFMLSVDDFGTGYSSLAYLKRLPIDTLKVDRSFVRDLGNDKDDATIVTTIIGLAHNLGMSVVAEGAETLEQVEFLKAHDCDSMQGYWYCKPLPFDELVTFLEKAAPRG